VTGGIVRYVCALSRFGILCKVFWALSLLDLSES
jgi:hypothetical protein